MQNVTKLTLSLLLLVGLSTVLIVSSGETATAQGNDQPQQSEQQQDTQEQSYTYTAKDGDSYTVLARKAVQTYGIDNQVDLSGAEIIFVETNLTQKAGAPVLEVGEEVSIDRTDVEEWVKKAQELSEPQETLWNQYVAGVDFDTSNNG